MTNKPDKTVSSLGSSLSTKDGLAPKYTKRLGYSLDAGLLDAGLGPRPYILGKVIRRFDQNP